MDTCNDFLLSRLCHVEENNPTFNNSSLIKTKINTWNSFYVYVEENNEALLKAGFTQGIPSTWILIKMLFLDRSWNYERFSASVEAGKIKRTLLK